MQPEERTSGKTIAIVAYILIVGVLIAMSMNAEQKDRFAAFHIRQAAGLSILFLSLGLLVGPFDSWLITTPMYFGVMVLWLFGIVTAMRGQMVPIPLLGNIFQKALHKL